MKLNKKGFAVSTILYALLIIFLLLIVLIFTLFDSTNGLFSRALDNKINNNLITNIDWKNTGNFNVVGNVFEYKFSEDDFSLPEPNISDVYSYSLSNTIVVNPYIPGDYAVTYTIKDENGNILPDQEKNIVVRVPEPQYNRVVDTTIGDYSGNGALDGTGTAEDPYLIKSIEDLVAISRPQLSLSGYFLLYNNLDFNNDLSYDDPSRTTYGDVNGNGITEGLKIEVTTGKGFYPISKTTAFDGNFNGNNKYINNLYILRNTGATTSLKSNNAFFSKTSANSKIYNLNFSNAYVNGYGYNAVIVANAGGTISNCNVINGNVISSSTYTGLVAGYSSNNISGVIVSGNVSGTTSIGGITGYKSSSKILSGIYTDGSVTCSGDLAKCKRIAGINYEPLNIVDASTINTNISAFAKSTITINNAVVSTDTTSVGSNGGNINNISQINNINLLNMVYDTYIGGDDDGDGYYFDYYDENSNVIVLKSTTVDPILPLNLSGEGTQENPYIISNYSDLKKATVVSLDSTLEYFKLTNSIDMSNKNFYIFGGVGNAFNAHFDGQAYSINNIEIDMPIVSMVGFTRYMFQTASIRNTYFSNFKVVGESYVGSIAGFNRGEIFTCVISNIDVNGSGLYIGGVSGYSYFGGFYSSTISSTVEGKQYIGGVYGYLNNGTVRVVVKDGNIVSTISSTDSGRILGGKTGTPILYNYAYKSDEKIKVNDEVVSSQDETSLNGKDASLTDINNLTIYSNAWFNTTAEDSYIWYIDNGVVKMRKGTSQTQ